MLCIPWIFAYVSLIRSKYRWMEVQLLPLSFHLSTLLLKAAVLFICDLHANVIDVPFCGEVAAQHLGLYPQPQLQACTLGSRP